MNNRNSILSNIPVVTKNLLFINFIVFLVDALFERRFYIRLSDYLGLHYIGSRDFGIWQLFTYMFMHANFTHIFFNMFAVFMFACPLEQRWGTKRFLTYYLVAGVGAGLIQEFVWWLYTINGYSALYAVTIGASGAVFGVLFAFGWLFPDVRLFIFPLPIPIRARVIVTIYAFIELFEGVANFTGDNVAHFAHLGGMLFGWLLILLWRRFDDSFNATGSNYSYNIGETWQKIKSKIEEWTGGKKDTTRNEYHYQDPIDSTSSYSKTKGEEDEDRRHEELDEILEKIRKHGYDSLTSEEKSKLFKK